MGLFRERYRFFIGYYKVTRETGSVLCQPALWDCFGNAIASFTGYYKVARETGGAYHLTENFGNSGLKVNGKVTFRKFRPKIEEYVLR